MPIFGLQNANFAKTTLYYGPEKIDRMPFFLKYIRKYPIITVKNIETPLQNTL